MLHNKYVLQNAQSRNRLPLLYRIFDIIMVYDLKGAPITNCHQTVRTNKSNLRSFLNNRTQEKQIRTLLSQSGLHLLLKQQKKI